MKNTSILLSIVFLSLSSYGQCENEEISHYLVDGNQGHNNGNQGNHDGDHGHNDGDHGHHDGDHNGDHEHHDGDHDHHDGEGNDNRAWYQKW